MSDDPKDQMPPDPRPEVRVEINPGEMFMVAPRMIHTHEYESILGDMSKIGSDESQLMYMFTFTGRVNHTTDIESVTVAMPPEAAWNLLGDMLKGFEMLKDAGMLKDSE